MNSYFEDRLVGNSGNNKLIGGGIGNDYLIDRPKADTFVCGLGYDTII